jgi:hypothetical protein
MLLGMGGVGGCSMMGAGMIGKLEGVVAAEKISARNLDGGCFLPICTAGNVRCCVMCQLLIHDSFSCLMATHRGIRHGGCSCREGSRGLGASFMP